MARGLCAWVCAASAGAATPGYRSQVTAEFVDRVEPAMRMPSDVAVGPAGAVYVADGVNDRIIEFGVDGGVIRRLSKAGGSTLSRPLGVEVSSSGGLWIADTGNARIVALNANGDLAQELRPPPLREQPPDITDIAFDGPRNRVWFVDNEADQIGFVDLIGGATTRFGARGESRGQFYHPYGLAVGSDGDVFATDVLNGRVQLLEPSGQVAASIGRYGVDVGELYRPKGVAIGPSGEIWVSDSRIGTIQFFRETGECLGVLLDSSGAPARFAAPSGLTFDASGGLYVAELGADRVVRLNVERPEKPTIAAMGAVRASRQPRNCTACHVEWLSPLVDGRSTPLFDPPRNTPSDPAVARSENCLSCHDGTVVDSRRRVWISHAHPRGQKPPEGMSVPKRFPLIDGGVACRTCHSAHTRGGSGETIATAVFLRVSNDPAELCIGCHSEKATPERPGHPMQPLVGALPAELASAHGQTHGSQRLMTCLTCHNAHGGGSDLLLDLPGSESRLCLHCHVDYGLQAGDRRPNGLHPIDVSLDAETAGAVRATGGRVGHADLLICSSCHAMHNAAAPDHLLRSSPAESANCRTCHSGQAEVLDTVHNLAATHPELVNAAGVAVADAGACSACHMVHQRAVTGEARLENDPFARCTPCHSENQIAADHALSNVNHRGATCHECHNPHDDRHGSFLQQPAGALCRSCHSGYDAFVGGPHDVGHNAERWPGPSQGAGADCLACHRPHGTAETGLFRNGLAAGQSAADGACIQCHQDAAWGGATPLAALHPRIDAASRNASALPLGDSGAVECATCHNPHAGPGQRGLLRSAGAATMLEHALCVSCHSDLTTLHASAHTPAEMKAAGLDVFACGPCHQAHGSPSSAGAKSLFGASVLASEGTPAGSTNDRFCIGCHRTGGPARTPAIATHPDVPMSARLTDVNALPLFDAAGHAAPSGKMTCRTCHTPHGREPVVSGAAATISEAETRAQRNLVRPFGKTNLCIDCHGFDGYSRFLYFHDAQRRRGGSNQDSTPALWKPRPGR